MIFTHHSTHHNATYFAIVGENQFCKLHAAHAMANGITIGVFLEPLDRAEGDWNQDLEDQMRQAIRNEIATWEDHDEIVVQFDPGRNEATSETVKRNQ